MLVYDQEAFEKYREKAITNKNDLVVGETYYSRDGEFVLLELVTHAEYYRREGLDLDLGSSPDKDEIRWMYIMRIDPRTQVERVSSQSLRDNNIRASYNPWLIFKDKKDFEAYEREVKVSYDRSDDPFWDFEPEWYYYSEED